MDDVQKHMIVELLKGRSYGEVLAEVLPFLERFQPRLDANTAWFECPNCHFNSNIHLN